MLFIQRHLSTKMEWTQDVLLSVKQKQKLAERAWDVSNSDILTLEFKYSVHMPCAVLTWNHELSLKVHLHTYEKEVIFGSF